MDLPKITTDLNIISALPDAPVQTSTQLKAKFDEGVVTIQDFLNSTLIPALEVSLTGKQGVVSGVSDNEIGFLDGVTSSIQTQINDKQTQLNNKQKTITSGTNAPSGGSNGDIYLRY